MRGARVDYGWQDEYVTTLDDVRHSLQPAYGLLSAKLTYTSSDGSWDVGLGGTNLQNTFYQMSGFQVPGWVDMGTVGRPREYALTFRYRLK